jgi:hypothetical protein
MKHLASPSFWENYERLPEEIRDLADQGFDVLKTNSPHKPDNAGAKYSDGDKRYL